MKTIILCDNCIQALRSRGENVTIVEPFYAEEEEAECEWCEDMCDSSELHICELR